MVESKIDIFDTEQLLNNPMSFDNLIYNISKLHRDYFNEILYVFIDILDTKFFNSKYRKEHFESKGKKSRTIVTKYGEVTIYRRSYVNKITKKDHFYYIDKVFNLEKNKSITMEVILMLLFLRAEGNSLSKVGRELGKYVFKDVDVVENLKYFSRSFVWNYFNDIEFDDVFSLEQKKVDNIYIELDEKYIPIQRKKNSGVPEKDAFTKVAKIYIENNGGVYKERFILLDNFSTRLQDRLFNYVSSTYDLDYVENIFIQGDGANWIRSTKELFGNKASYLIDKFHYTQSLMHITTSKRVDIYDAVYKNCILANDKNLFKRWITLFASCFPQRIDTIRTKGDYILSNWASFQRTINFIKLDVLWKVVFHTLWLVYVLQDLRAFLKMV